MSGPLRTPLIETYAPNHQPVYFLATDIVIIYGRDPHVDVRPQVVLKHGGTLLEDDACLQHVLDCWAAWWAALCDPPVQMSVSDPRGRT